MSMTKEEADKAWAKFTHPSYEEYYQGISDFKQALRKRIEKEEEDRFKYWSTGDILDLLDTTPPLRKKR